MAATLKNLDAYEVSLTVPDTDPGQLEILKVLLERLGVTRDRFIELSQNGLNVLSIYYQNTSEGETLRRKLVNCGLKNVEIHGKTLKGSDWQNKWKKDFRPFQLTERFDVVPFAYRKEYKKQERQPVYIDTSFAFGTGLHATTRFMAGFVERASGKFESFLDIGTGTGILSLIALHCGATDVTAIDLRKDIIEIANTNFEANGFKKQKARAVNFEKFKAEVQFDFVAANLITQDLIEFGRKIVARVKPGQFLAVSGISLNNYPMFRENFQQYPLKCVKVERGEGWVAVLYKRTS